MDIIVTKKFKVIYLNYSQQILTKGAVNAKTG